MIDATHATVSLRRITIENVETICDLSSTLSPEQRKMVADNGESIAVAHYSEDAWFRAIYADDTPAGFIMLHTSADWSDGIDFSGIFLWRLMIAGPHQGKGYGKKAIGLVLRNLAARGIWELYTSCGEGPGSPLAFYRQLGFEPTGDYYGDELELRLCFTADILPSLLGDLPLK
ncbi:GNAT family N-acetyltransferase [Chitinophaga nivalis]|uniref:GNAT family N-acetyltransferase n=1 Tax=Chitinophaga nivalis TaxID=2991709 RepID=A0ABT3IMQ6_9BACT|nr:GNAT family N-acetyltransferase [Chitinophaga nivalis]MCW3465055.1 GNAT family N-acetyltransferase [Chitinophaga nivalis]MCW3485253.1 GNAT family N-acetyltransferase [Chitinophaga nivalis]